MESLVTTLYDIHIYIKYTGAYGCIPIHPYIYPDVFYFRKYIYLLF